MVEDNSKYNIKSLEKVLKILNLFRDNEGYTLTEISKLADINKSTALRILKTLCNYNYIKYNKNDKTYELGFMFYVLGYSAFNSMNITKIAMPFLIEAAERSNLICNFGILEGSHVVIMEKIWPKKRKQFNTISTVGGVLPCYCTSLGKVILVDKTNDEIREIMKNVVFEKFTKNTIKNVDQLIKEVETARINNFAIDIAEHEPYIKCIAYPIYGMGKRIVAAISLTGLIEEVTNMDENLIHNVLKKASHDISYLLGGIKEPSKRFE